MKDLRVDSTVGPPPVGPYPHARRVGDFIFVSGMGPRQRGSDQIPGNEYDASGKLIQQDIRIQTQKTIENISAVLKEAGSSLDQVVDVTCFLTNMKRDFAGFNEVYGTFFKEIGPTRTTLEVLSLPTPICVELKVIAYSSLQTK